MFFMLTKIHPRSSGFTGFELLIVIALVGILAWLVVSRFSDLSTDARNIERRLDISIIAAELEGYKNAEGHYPPTASTLPSYSQFLNEGVPTSDTIAFLDPAGNPIEDSPTASTNIPTTGYNPDETPEGAQYTYAPYGCNPVDQPQDTEAEDTGAEETPNNEEDSSETEADGQAEDQPDDTETEAFDTCQGYVLYAWLENDTVYSKVNN